MRVLAAIDLRGGAAVQLVGGRPSDERVRLDDVTGLVRRWERSFAGLHVVDLDAALEDGDNGAVVREIVLRSSVPVQVGGGLRDDDAVQRALDLGAARAIVGTRGVDDPDWLARLARRLPHRLILAADVRDDVVLRRGWTDRSALTLTELLERVAGLPLAGVLVTDVGREGGMAGVDAALFARAAALTTHRLVAAGGIGDLDDLRRLAATGVDAAVVGMALYTGAIEPDTVAREFPQARRDLRCSEPR